MQKIIDAGGGKVLFGGDIASLVIGDVEDPIEVTVTHTLDPKWYDLPLTAKTTLPADWKLVRFRQGTEVRWLPIHREAGKTFVQYRIAPNGGVARLEKGL